MSSNNNDKSNGWDLGVSEFIEETPVIDPKEPTQFSKIPEANGTHIYLMRRAPSWSQSQKNNEAA